MLFWELRAEPNVLNYVIRAYLRSLRIRDGPKQTEAISNLMKITFCLTRTGF